VIELHHGVTLGRRALARHRRPGADVAAQFGARHRLLHRPLLFILLRKRQRQIAVTVIDVFASRRPPRHRFALIKMSKHGLDRGINGAYRLIRPHHQPALRAQHAFDFAVKARQIEPVQGLCDRDQIQAVISKRRRFGARQQIAYARMRGRMLQLLATDIAGKHLGATRGQRDTGLAVTATDIPGNRRRRQQGVQPLVQRRRITGTKLGVISGHVRKMIAGAIRRAF
jgi:hypothetical protein